jgi:PAS domain S-box-containing protein
MNFADPASQPDPIQSLLDELSTEITNLPTDQKPRIAATVQKIRARIPAVVANEGKPDPSQQAIAELLAVKIAYGELLDCLTDPCTVYDADLRMVYRNQANREAVQVPDEQAIGKPFVEIYPHLAGTDIHQAYLLALQTRQPRKHLSHWIRPTDGQEFYSDLFLYPTSSGGLIAFSKDATERIRTETALREAHERAVWISRFPEENPMPVARISLDGKILYHNRASGQLPGWKLILGEQIPAHLFPLLQQAIVSGKQVEWDVPMGERIYSIIFLPFPEEQYANLYGYDITERKQAEEQLADQAKLLDLVHDAIFVMDDQLIITYWNQAAERQYGWSQEEALGKNAPQLIRSEVTDQERQRLLQQSKETGGFRGEVIHHTKEDRHLVIEANMSVRKDPSGRVIGYLTANRDVTARKQAEKALEQALIEVENEKNRLLAIMETLPIGVVIVDAQGGILQANKEYENIWGGSYPTTQSVADYGSFKAWWADSGEPVQPYEWASAQAVQKGETVKGQLIEIQRFDGTRGIVLNSGSPIRDAQGRITGCAVGIMDITEQKQLEAEQRDQHVKMEIQHRLLEYREQERQALARDLHDGPVQSLASLLFNVQFAKEAITDPAVKVELDLIASRLKTTVQDLRETINEMRPPSLIRFGLAKAMNVFLEEFRENHPEIDFAISLMDDGSSLSEQARLGFYRILQEALANTIRHANAKRISVALRCEDRQTVMEIHDDGRGFSLTDNLVDYSVRGHYGLVGMKERAEAIGGTFEIASIPEKGTTIRVIVPVVNLNTIRNQ